MSKKTICIKCGSITTLILNGKDIKGTQRYKCASCQKTFILNSSPVKHFKTSHFKLKKFIGYMIDDVSLKVISRNLSINIKTAHYYRYLIFSVIASYQDNLIINGKILLDETYVPIREKEFKFIPPDGKNLRGLSRNQLCLITIINLSGKCVIKVSSRGVPHPKDYISLLNQNIGNINLIVYDGNTHNRQFVNQFKCAKINLSKSDSEEYNLNYSDSLHSALKRYLYKHIGMRLKNIQDYVNFFVYKYNFISSKSPQNMREEINVNNELNEDLHKRFKASSKKISYKSFLNNKGITDILAKKE